MKNIYDLHELKETIDSIIKNPEEDFDDILFNLFLNYSALGKVCELKNKVIEDNGKKYIEIGLNPNEDVRVISFHDLFASFIVDFVDYQGFAVNGIVIEIGFIEEIISSLDTSALCITLGDITNFDGDAIVNAANNELKGGSGVDGQIHNKAGKELDAECQEIGWCDTGKAVITGAYDLPVNYVIHTVGPIYSGKVEDAELLASCYKASLDLARENGISSIAFPVISTGAYSYPFLEAFKIAKLTIDDYLDDHPEYPMLVYLYIYKEEQFNQILEAE